MVKSYVLVKYYMVLNEEVFDFIDVLRICCVVFIDFLEFLINKSIFDK